MSQDRPRKPTQSSIVDLNGNGLIGSDEPLLLSFLATDGIVPKIAGVRNLNVPGDEDGLPNAQIRIELPLPGVDQTALRAAIKSIFRFSAEPAGGFAAVTQPFTVFQRVRAEGVSGQIFRA